MTLHRFYVGPHLIPQRRKKLRYLTSNLIGRGGEELILTSFSSMWLRWGPHLTFCEFWGGDPQFWYLNTWIMGKERESHLSFFWQFEKNTSYEITIKLPRLKVFYPYPHDFKCILRILNIMYNLHGISWIYANVLELDKIKPSLFHNFIIIF